MTPFDRKPRARKKPASHIALAVALATGTALIGTVAAQPAIARTKEKKAAAYSKEFVAAFTPVQEALNTEGADMTAAAAQIPALVALANTPDEKNAAGSMAYNVGLKAQNQELQLQGVGLMLESGKIDEANLGKFNFLGYQLATVAGKHAQARGFLEQAMKHNFSSAEVSPAALRIAMAESYFNENRIDEGLDYLSTAIAEQKAAGQPVDVQWYRRGLSVAYNASNPKVYRFVIGWIGDFPSESNWRDAINIARNLNDYSGAEMLDLMRLNYRKGTIKNKQEYIDYVEAADARRLPKEVQTVINQGYATGHVSKDDIYIADALKLASGRIAADHSELPALERDARAANAGIRTVVAAGDAFLSYGEAGKAAEFYAKALTMPGVDRNLVLTRLGIAQSDAGDYAGAKANFDQVTGKRAPIAMLWSAYTAEKAGASTPAATTVASTEG